MQFRQRFKYLPTSPGCGRAYCGTVVAAVGLLCWPLIAGPMRVDQAVLVKDGNARAAIFVPARLVDDRNANPEPATVWRTLKPEDNRRRLRESVRDMAAILKRMSGAEVEIVSGAPTADEKRLPILIGELAAERFGKPEKAYPYEQGFRITVSEQGVGLTGASDLATSYAIYTLLHDLGCRWYMPGSLGEVLPTSKSIELPGQDRSTGPFTVYRGIWYCDNDFARRNRLGGMELAAGHALEFIISKEMRQSNPDIRAIVNGKPHEHRIKWTHPFVAQTIADTCLEQIKKDPGLRSFSLSPDDGLGWDESDDAKFDAGDFDPSTQTVSKTDRLMVLCNRVAGRVAPQHLDLKFGVLAYVDFNRAPVREKVHPNVVPMIAPISFSRAHAMTDDGEPNNRALRALVEGWAKAAPATSYYFYGWALAEGCAPNPMIAKWSIDIPLVFTKGNCRYWQPETIPNFETSIHAHMLGIRLAWDPTQDPAVIIGELHEKFYGHAAGAMAAYWQYVDDVWTKTPEYAGGPFGHLRRWTPERLAKSRQLLKAAAGDCRADAEKTRVGLASESLGLFELFMKLKRDHAEGRFANLAAEGKQYREAAKALGERHKDDYCFGQMHWTKPDSLNAKYYSAFHEKTFEDATRIGAGFQVLTTPPLRQWRYQKDDKKAGESEGWFRPDFDDSVWKVTDCAIDTWSALGMHNHMSSVWYRTRFAVPDISVRKKVYLWVGATDGRVKLFVNGQHVPYVNPKGETAVSFSGFCKPASFDVTAVIRPGAENQVSLHCTREELNEVGTGGLLSPVVVYREKD